MGERIALFIDGAYLEKITKTFSNKKIDHSKLVSRMTEDRPLIRCYYYDCLPYKSSPPKDDENTRFSQKEKFFKRLRHLDNFTVRLGKLAFRGVSQNGKEIFEQKKQRMEKKAWEFCAKRIEARNLPMKLIDVKYTEDLKKVVFSFVAENRVDFRELLKDLVKTLRVKIELFQVSRRDYAKKIGGIGICGRECCCKSFLKKFTPITVKMAKIQGLPLNPSKISGICGRLLCCLAYEKYEKPVTTLIQQIESSDEQILNIEDENADVIAEADVNWKED